MKKPIILASASPRRAQLLEQIGLTFSILESGVPEDDDAKTDPALLAAQLSVRKAAAVAQTIASGIVIAADTVVSVDGEILGKPKDREEAIFMLRRLSGKRHDVLTGVTVIVRPEEERHTHVESTAVVMREIADAEIDWYVDSGEPYDKAGGYGIQGRAAVFVDRLEGCYFNVVGLPLNALWNILAKCNIRIWEGAGESDNKAPDHQGFTPT